MQKPFFRRHRLAWVATFALMLGVLGPTVSRWLVTSNTLPLAMMEVCVNMVGAPSIMVNMPARDDSSPKTKMDHCPLCVMHTDALGLPHGIPVFYSCNELSELLPSLFLSAPRTLSVWAAALARAPPVSLA